MNRMVQKENLVYCETYPKWVIIIRGLVLTGAFVLGIYILSEIHPILGVAYVIFSLYALTLVLPLSRCVNCYYYEKLCNAGWGKVAGYLYRRGSESQYVGCYNYAILLHGLWIVPLLTALVLILVKRELLFLIIFLAYSFVLWTEKMVLKKMACKRWQQREFCPALPFRKAP